MQTTGVKATYPAATTCRKISFVASGWKEAARHRRWGSSWPTEGRLAVEGQLVMSEWKAEGRAV